MTKEEEIDFDNVNGHDDAREGETSTVSNGTTNNVDDVLATIKEAQLSSDVDVKSTKPTRC